MAGDMVRAQKASVEFQGLWLSESRANGRKVLPFVTVTSAIMQHRFPGGDDACAVAQADMSICITSAGSHFPDSCVMIHIHGQSKKPIIIELRPHKVIDIPKGTKYHLIVGQGEINAEFIVLTPFGSKPFGELNEIVHSKEPVGSSS